MSDEGRIEVPIGVLSRLESLAATVRQLDADCGGDDDAEFIIPANVWASMVGDAKGGVR